MEYYIVVLHCFERFHRPHDEKQYFYKMLKADYSRHFTLRYFRANSYENMQIEGAFVWDIPE